MTWATSVMDLYRKANILAKYKNNSLVLNVYASRLLERHNKNWRFFIKEIMFADETVEQQTSVQFLWIVQVESKNTPVHNRT